ncbi:hypothetical protein RchiOBHm_Chr5g0065991 [Rosa chinensis]|uniref:Uncharacterized protein n=1 Tax=Rosa chinensis TaxID=74649 RepID=A0A2P6QJ33_ROSCH|nr:hypothetical protein RchiOBHm_Chr5g0065991 [Rosa chinensis]
MVSHHRVCLTNARPGFYDPLADHVVDADFMIKLIIESSSQPFARVDLTL